MPWKIAIGNWSIDLCWFVWDSLLILRHVFSGACFGIWKSVQESTVVSWWNGAALPCSFRLVLDKGSLCFVKAQVLCNLLTFYMYISVLLDCLHGSCLSQMGERKLWNPTSDSFRNTLCLSVSVSLCGSLPLFLSLYREYTYTPRHTLFSPIMKRKRYHLQSRHYFTKDS